MSARRHQRRTNDASRRMAARITRQVAELIPSVVAQVHQAIASNPINPPPQPAVVNPPLVTRTPYHFKQFTSANPPKFKGSEGATGLLQWFEGIENTFLHSDCPEDKRTRYASSVFQGRALTWWNGEMRTRGAIEAMNLSWNELKDLMTREFCPRNEVKKLEEEFWELKQESGENLAYTNRFHELSLLVPHLVTPLDRAIEKFIGGLPMQIQDSVWSRDPPTLAEAIRLSAILTDNHVKAGTLSRKGSKKDSGKAKVEPPKEVKPESSSMNPQEKKRKFEHQNFALTTPQIPNQITPVTQYPKKPYTGPYPQCNICKYHHRPSTQCRQCTKCGRFGHFFNDCRIPIANQPNPPFQPLNQQQVIQPNIQQSLTVRACYICGDPNHLRYACPMLINNGNQGQASQANATNQEARGRVFNINANQAQNPNDVANGNL